jgi:hypothetical protein
VVDESDDDDDDDDADICVASKPGDQSSHRQTQPAAAAHFEWYVKFEILFFLIFL